MLGVEAIRRRLRRRALRRDGRKPEEEVFDRFAEWFGPTLRKGKSEESPKEAQEDSREEFQKEPQQEPPQDIPPCAPPEPAPPALEALGLSWGASPAEVTAAYRRLARTYHPDTVANEPEAVRAFAEERMKEINAAYSELKRRG